MASIEELKKQYQDLNDTFDTAPLEVIKSDLLMAFEYEYPGSSTEVLIDTDEFTAVCPWTGLPDFGTLKVRYVPNKLCIELKSMKYYLLSFTGVGVVQEHAANIILNDLKNVCEPISMSVELDYKIRGGLHTSVVSSYGE
ncbi:MAG: preQ(1) synthase [Chloroflexota bacterium]|jgi:7-cyano-7-deazaguanine reductase|nr:preQ(1) synthase [Chloroflexota bacterium]